MIARNRVALLKTLGVFDSDVLETFWSKGFRIAIIADSFMPIHVAHTHACCKRGVSGAQRSLVWSCKRSVFEIALRLRD
jgi:hypothetical protein